MLNGNAGGSHIRDHHRNEEGRDTFKSLLQSLRMFALHHFEAANAAGDNHAEGSGLAFSCPGFIGFLSL